MSDFFWDNGIEAKIEKDGQMLLKVADVVAYTGLDRSGVSKKMTALGIQKEGRYIGFADCLRWAKSYDAEFLGNAKFNAGKLQLLIAALELANELPETPPDPAPLAPKPPKTDAQKMPKKPAPDPGEKSRYDLLGDRWISFFTSPAFWIGVMVAFAIFAAVYHSTKWNSEIPSVHIAIWFSLFAIVELSGLTAVLNPQVFGEKRGWIVTLFLGIFGAYTAIQFGFAFELLGVTKELAGNAILGMLAVLPVFYGKLLHGYFSKK